MYTFYKTYQTEVIYTAVLLIILLSIRAILVIAVKKIGKRSGTIEVRVNLIGRYATVTILRSVFLIESFILGADFGDIAVVFLSVFAVIGIELFAIWSFLSNVSSVYFAFGIP
jgi:hypothetical protein